MGIASYGIEYRSGSGSGTGTRSLGRTGSHRYWSRVTLTTDSAGCSKLRVSLRAACYNGATKLSASEYAAGAQVVVSAAASNSAYTGSVANLAASHPANNTVWLFTGDVSCRLSPNTTYYLFVLPCWSAPDTFTQSTESFTVESLAGLGASTIASCSANASTLGTIQLTMTRFDASYQHVATFTAGGATLATSARFDASLGQSVPRAWFDGFPNATSLTVAVSVQTYNGETPVGSPAAASVTVAADAGMVPEIGSGFAAAAAYSAGTAAASIAGYVQGYSKARLTLDRSRVTLANGAAVASYAVTCQGATTTVASPGASETVDTGVLAASGDVPITVTVTDSRGRTASTSLTVPVMACAPPTLSEIDVFRCDGLGAASEDGTYVSVRATGGVSGLKGQNALTLTAKLAVGSGGYGTEQALASGAVRVLGGALDPDQRLRVLIAATDALGNESAALRSFPTRVWAMKFRADGRGVAFGKAPEHGPKKLELPADWTVMFGAETFLEKVYPVGSIYMSVSGTDPGTLFGGTWQRVQDTFLLAAGTTYAAGTTGGEAAHTLTVDEMPGHTHELAYLPTNAAGVEWVGAAGTAAPASRTSTAAGGGAAHNNMPPYLAVCVWKRTA